MLVDRHGDQEAAMVLVIGGEIGSAAAEGNAERAACDNHGLVLKTEK